jgi:hypothetical protein
VAWIRGSGSTLKCNGSATLLACILCYLDINARDGLVTAADAPGDETGKLPCAAHLADEGTAPVTLAGVLPLLPARAQESRMQGKVRSEPGLPQPPLALGIGDDWDVHLLHDVLVVAGVAEGVLAPAAHPAASVGEVLAWEKIVICNVIAMDSDSVESWIFRCGGCKLIMRTF